MPQVMTAVPRMATNRISTIAVSKTLFLRPAFIVTQPSLPLAGTQNGSLLNDRFNPNLKWYLPKYSVGAGVDPFFSFSASQSGTDSQGNPFNKGTLFLTLKKTMPIDVQAFKTANPTVTVQEVVPVNMTIYLTTTALDALSGQNHTSNYAGQITTTSTGDIQLSFDNIIGPGVIILYNNLQQKGAALSISYGYNAWSVQGQQKFFEVLHTTVTPTSAPNHPMLMMRTVALHPAVTTIHPLATMMHPVAAPVPSAAPAAPDPLTYQQIISDAVVSLSLDSLFNAGTYALKFTISSNGSAVRPIINVNDLTSFNTKQSEFSLLTTLGDISQKYPSLSRLYIGSLSRTIMVIPANYSIQRSSHGLTTLCQALLDSETGSDTTCKFEFTFTISPDISAIEFLQLSEDVGQIAALQDYTVVLPTFLKEGTSPVLVSAFHSSLQCAASVAQHNFDLGVEIKDQTSDSPAVAAANILLRQLSQDGGPYLMGTIFLKLDDNYSDPVPASVVLNFHRTSSSDELTFSVDSTANTISFQNNSPLDLLINRYGICDAGVVTIVNGNLIVKANAVVTTPCKAITATMNIIADSELNVPGDIAKENIGNFLVFQEEDVQSTKFTFGVNASAVDFDKTGLRQIDVQIVLSDLPNISIPSFSVTKLGAVNSSFALIPIQQAISSLEATLQYTLHAADTTKPDTVVSLNHQFMDDPIVILQATDIIKSTS